MSISNLDELRDHLQTAVEVEWSTIPPYLCALWSIEEGTNVEASEAIEDVVMEEMLHLTLAANVLNALGGSPQLVPPRGKPPTYPTFLPHSADTFEVSLRRFSRDALHTFMAIEHPAHRSAPPEPERYHTIAQFYEAILQAIDDLCRDPPVWTGDPAFQVGPGTYYYGGGGDAVVVTDLASAADALDVIVNEGEGMPGSIFEDDVLPEELAHYFRFEELSCGRRYVRGDTPSSGPTGPPILLDYDSVLPMGPNPKASDHPPGSELREAIEECDATYTGMVSTLHDALNGTPELLLDGVQTMYRLRAQAVALMHVPVGEDGTTAGPPFEWRGR